MNRLIPASFMEGDFWLCEQPERAVVPPPGGAGPRAHAHANCRGCRIGLQAAVGRGELDAASLTFYDEVSARKLAADGCRREPPFEEPW